MHCNSLLWFLSCTYCYTNSYSIIGVNRLHNSCIYGDVSLYSRTIMVWILEAGTLLIVAFVLRRALHMAPQRLRFCFSKGYAGPESDVLYSQVATEFGTHTA